MVAADQRCIDAGAEPIGGDATYIATQLWSTLHGFADLRIGKPEMAWPPPHHFVADTLKHLRLDRPAHG
jgi:hypothetical protein